MDGVEGRDRRSVCSSRLNALRPRIKNRVEVSWPQGIDQSSSDQSAHQESDGEGNTNDSQWALTNPLTRLRD